MEWKNKYVDPDNMSLMFEFADAKEAKYVTDSLCKSIWGKGELYDLNGLVTNVTTVVRYVVIGTDASMDELLEIINFVGELCEPVNEDFSMGVEGSTGLNQGIPNGGPGKGVIPAPLFGKGKTVTRDEDEKKLKKALDVLDVYGVKVKKTKKVSEDAMPELFCRNQWTVDDVDHYLYHDLGYDGGEVDDLIALNIDLINQLLEKGKSPAEVADALDYSTITDAED
jgi:hypothetical protein